MVEVKILHRNFRFTINKAMYEKYSKICKKYERKTFNFLLRMYIYIYYISLSCARRKIVLKNL